MLSTLPISQIVEHTTTYVKLPFIQVVYTNASLTLPINQETKVGAAAITYRLPITQQVVTYATLEFTITHFVVDDVIYVPHLTP